MKVRLLLVAALIAVFVGAVSIVGVGETGTITAGIVLQLEVSFDSALSVGDLTGPYDGTGGSTDGSGIGFLELRVESNKDYTVQLECSGNLGIGGEGAHWRDQLETEYAIWKQIIWNDTGVAQPPYSGWVDDDDFSWWNHSDGPIWFEADDSLVTQRQGGYNDETTNPNDFLFMQPGGYLPEHYETFDGWAADPTGWNDSYYNYGADLTLRFFPGLTPYDNFGTRAGAYTGTITVVITNVDP